MTNEYISNLIEKIKDRSFDENVDDDILVKKNAIASIFYNDSDLIDLLHLKDTSLDNLNEHICPHLKLNGIKDFVGNYVLYDIQDIGVSYTNDSIKNQELTIMCLVDEADMDTEYTIPINDMNGKKIGENILQRHDLLGYVIRDLFNRSNILGKQLKLTSNQVDIFDSKYYGRTLKFLIKAPNVDQGGGNKYGFYHRNPSNSI